MPTETTIDDRNAPVLVARDEQVCRITLNRPERLNAIDLEANIALADALESAESDPSVRVCVISGTPPFFSAGLDIKWLPSATDAEKDKYWEVSARVRAVLAYGRTATIARINGDAYGGGLHLVNRCDISIAARGVKAASSEARVGLHAGGTFMLDIGRTRSLDLNLTGRAVSAEDLERWGLLTRVVEPDLLDATVDEYVDAIRAISPDSIAATKAATAFWMDLMGRDAHRKYSDELQFRLQSAAASKEVMTDYLTSAKG